MAEFGYTLMGEQSGPTDLVDSAVGAERAGFDFAVCSDHYYPWLDAQGHSPYAWAVLGAAAYVAKSIGLMSFVTCPIRRYHPAVVAQKAATVALMSRGRPAAVRAGRRLLRAGRGRVPAGRARAVPLVRPGLAGQRRTAASALVRAGQQLGDRGAGRSGDPLRAGRRPPRRRGPCLRRRRVHPCRAGPKSARRARPRSCSSRRRSCCRRCGPVSADFRVIFLC